MNCLSETILDAWWKGRMIRLGGAVPVFVRLGATKPSTSDTFPGAVQVVVRMPREIPFDIKCTLLPGR